jgi:DNA repair exonuclease SbcCD ATPase subunit
MPRPADRAALSIGAARLLFPALALLLCASAAAQEAGANPPAAGDAGLTDQALELWQRSAEQAGTLWERSRDTAGDWWQRSRGAWDGARDALTPAAPDAFGQVWTNVVPKLEETVALEDVQRDLPEKAWFRRDQADVQADIDDLLDASVAILSASPVQQYREQIRALETSIRDARAAIDQYRKARVAAPEKSLVERTIADYDRLIGERERAIARAQSELRAIKQRFAAELRGMGLELSDEQLEFLLSTVVGDNIVDLGIVFDNVKAITAQLEALMRETGEDLDSARRYYGMYLVLLRALNRMHLDVEQAIDERYVPQINDIAERARALSAETRELKRRHPEKAEILDANLAAQQLTVEAAEVYRRYLKEQGGQVAQARAALQEDIATAWNTYETVRVSGELVDLVQSSQKLLDGLLRRQVPALRPFQNLEMQRELSKLTEQLRAAEG